ncbi:PH domain-containing protein [Burkholderiaceae bacterium UC74_6]
MQATLPDEVRRELSAGEQMLWSGRPRQGLVLRGADALMIPFSLLWCGFAIFWEYNAATAPNAPVFFALWGVPFVCLGLYIVFGRFFIEARQRTATHYAVTAERVLIVSGVFSREVKSLALKTLSDVSLRESSGGEGTITFGPQQAFAGMSFAMPGWPGSAKFMAPRFDLIQDAKTVYQIIRGAQRG